MLRPVLTPLPSQAQPPAPPVLAPAAAPPGPRGLALVSKGFFLWSWVIGTSVGWLGLSVLETESMSAMGVVYPGGVRLAFIVLGVVGMLYAGIVRLVLLYKMWAAIQPYGCARTTPGVAIGFLFIPFYNFYWFFQAMWGWTRDYNLSVERARLHAPRVSEGLGFTLAAMQIVVLYAHLIPGGGYVGVVFLVLGAVFVAMACDAVNALAAGPSVASADSAGESAAGWGRAVAGGLLGLIGYSLFWPRRFLYVGFGHYARMFRHLDEVLEGFAKAKPGPAGELWGLLAGLFCLTLALVVSIRGLMGPRHIESMRWKQWSLAGVLIPCLAVLEVLWVIVLIVVREAVPYY